MEECSSVFAIKVMCPKCSKRIERHYEEYMVLSSIRCSCGARIPLKTVTEPKHYQRLADIGTDGQYER